MDCDALEEILGEMDAYSIPETDTALWHKLKEASENLDYDSIMDILKID